MAHPESNQSPAPAFAHGIASSDQLSFQPGRAVHVAIVGLALTLAFFAGAFLQRGVDAWIYGPLPAGVITCSDPFERVCIALLLLLNPQLLAFISAFVVLPLAWLPAVFANALFVALIPAWWGLVAWLAKQPSRHTLQ